MINHTMVLTINGTRRSEKAGGLDDGEVRFDRPWHGNPSLLTSRR